MNESIYQTPDGYISGCLTLRDYFAAKTFIPDGSLPCALFKELIRKYELDSSNENWMDYMKAVSEYKAKIRFMEADAMLNAREAK